MLYLHERETICLSLSTKGPSWVIEKGQKLCQRVDILYFVLNLVKIFREDEVTGCSKMSKKAEEGKGR